MGSMMKHVLLIRNLNEEIAPEAYSLPPCKALRHARMLQWTSGGRTTGTGTGTGTQRHLHHLRQHGHGPVSWTWSNLGMNIYSVTQSRCHDSLSDKTDAKRIMRGKIYALETLL